LLVFPPPNHRVVALSLQLHLAHEFVNAFCLFEAGLHLHGVVNWPNVRIFGTVFNMIGLNLRGQFTFRLSLDDNRRTHFQKLVDLTQIVIFRHLVILI
jgi:membrane protein required for beta-lactamase induction